MSTGDVEIIPPSIVPGAGPGAGAGGAATVLADAAAGLRDAAPGLTDAVAQSALAGSNASVTDQLHIHPLDLNGAMQIMIAEVRAELPLPGEAPRPLPTDALRGVLRLEPSLPATAPQTLVQLFLQSLQPPESLEPAVWLAAVIQVEGAVQVALDRAVAAVTVWRDVPDGVVDAARVTREVVVAAITGDPPNPLWLRPEWLGLAPRLERHRRRRKRAERWLSDPDSHWREQEADPARDPQGNR